MINTPDDTPHAEVSDQDTDALLASAAGGATGPTSLRSCTGTA
jgi:hypothetical protein